MMRTLHRWPGLVLAALLSLMALSGAALSLFPALEAVQAPTVPDRLSVAELAARVQAHHPGLEQIKRTPSGQITAWWFEGEQPGSAVVDPATGRDVASADPGPVQRWLTTLHRSLFLGDVGRGITAAGALGLLGLCWSGLWLVARRTGGWRRWFTRLHGPLAGRLHTEIARVAVSGLLLSSLTALWMSAGTFGLISIESARLEPPATVSGQAALPLAQLEALRRTPVTALRELSFPLSGDPQAVYTLRTPEGLGAVDAGTGKLLAWQALGLEERLSEAMLMLHTGQGAAVLGLLLGLMALGVPLLGLTGVWRWWSGWCNRPELRGNAPAAQAETVVLVGSEGGSTWGFAATLAEALRSAGQSVHVTALRDFAPARHRHAQRHLILTATYGDGDAPASAQGFLDRLQAMDTPPRAPLAVLGFGDRSFPAFCAFAATVEAAARARGWPLLLPLHTIDRQSPQDFARWGCALGEALGLSLPLAHQPVQPATVTLTLLERRDYGHAVQAPMAILRFGLPPASCGQRFTGQGFARVEPGDLLGIVPDGSTVPRLYSLASGSREGFLEIVVRRHPGGLASTQLTDLVPGQTVRAFVRHHPAFHAGTGHTPLILIGAGTGVAPLAGMVRQNQSGRPIQVFFGLRDPDSDFLYQPEWDRWQAAGQLTRLTLAVSRGKNPQYVQDALRQAAPQVVEAIRQGGTVMVCGSRALGRAVADTLTELLQPLGLSPTLLKAGGRYAEDLY